MKVTRTAVLSSAAALLILSACGQSNDAGDTPAVGETDMTSAVTSAPTIASANRDWMPPVIVLPQPHTVVADMDVGLRTHYLQILVKDDPTPEFAGWKEALVAAGYEVKDATATGSLLFSSVDVETGQIAVKPADDHEGFIIQVDVTRRQ